MNQRNYQRELDSILDRIPRGEKRLFLHSCCAPCSSYVLEYLSAYFQITVSDPVYCPALADNFFGSSITPLFRAIPIYGRGYSGPQSLLIQPFHFFPVNQVEPSVQISRPQILVL